MNSGRAELRQTRSDPRRREEGHRMGQTQSEWGCPGHRRMGGKSDAKTRNDPRSPFTAAASEKREARGGRGETTRRDRGPYSVPLHQAPGAP